MVAPHPRRRTDIFASREFLLRQGKGVVHVAPGVSGLIEIALKFHEPVMA
jgi:hypothetical protein